MEEGVAAAAEDDALVDGRGPEDLRSPEALAPWVACINLGEGGLFLSRPGILVGFGLSDRLGDQSLRFSLQLSLRFYKREMKLYSMLKKRRYYIGHAL